ncbi:ParB/RepB/Spo0J family partition protein [Streptomyces sp. NPDC059447]|uniref:ParB/RepB/Spo0J family partition protein n=1 Tax=Streptomyces sp. NPDC059447 TaxID=3346834 RepID=UPI0036820C65
MQTSIKARPAGPIVSTADVAALSTANPLPSLDVTALVEDIAAHGILEPLHVATTEEGTLRVIDGRRRLAAALTLSLAEVPVTYRPLISVTALRAHPGNVRKDLRLTSEFTNSIRVEGVRTPLVVTRTADGQLQVVDGHRRLAAAIEAEVTHLPYVYEDRDEAGQVLDMITTARHRAPLTRGEENAALFEAASLGADARRIAAAGSTTLVKARALKRLSKSQAVRTAAAQALAELEDNPNGNPRWIIRRILSASKARKEAEAHRAELEKAGATIRAVSELRESATRVRSLPKVTLEAHATCQGHVWALEDGANSYTAYCTNPALYGHKMPDTGKDKGKPTAEERRAVIQGNRDWDTATAMRAEWLAALFGAGRRTKAATDRMAEITATVLVSGASVVVRRASHPSTRARICAWMGLPQHTAESARAEAVAKTPAKATLYGFAAIVAAYEQNADRTVWRHKGGTRTEAAQYLSWLVSLGYKATPIEQAVIDGKAYTPSAPATGKANGKR